MPWPIGAWRAPPKATAPPTSCAQPSSARTRSPSGVANLTGTQDSHGWRGSCVRRTVVRGAADRGCAILLALDSAGNIHQELARGRHIGPEELVDHQKMKFSFASAHGVARMVWLLNSHQAVTTISPVLPAESTLAIEPKVVTKNR